MNNKTTEEFLSALIEKNELETDEDIKKVIFALGLPLTIKVSKIDVDETERRHDDFKRIVQFIKSVQSEL